MKCTCSARNHPNHVGGDCKNMGDPNFEGFCSVCKTLTNAEEAIDDNEDQKSNGRTDFS